MAPDTTTSESCLDDILADLVDSESEYGNLDLTEDQGSDSGDDLPDFSAMPDLTMQRQNACIYMDVRNKALYI